MVLLTYNDCVKLGVAVRKRDLAEPQGGDDEERMQAIASLSATYSIALILVALAVVATAVLITLFLIGLQVMPAAPG